MTDTDTSRRPAIRVIAFNTDYVPDKENPGQMKAIDWVEWGKIGDRTGATTRERIKFLAPRRQSDGTMKAAVEWEIVGPAYERWKANEEIPIEGTPLAAWPGADRALVDALKKLNVLTVEDFVNSPDHAFNAVPVPDLRRRRKMAEDFLLAQGEQAKVEAELASRDAKLASQAMQIEDLQEQIKLLMEQMPKPDKPRLKAVK